MDKQEQKEEIRVIDPLVDMIIPQCCREGWDSCKHIVGKEKQKKKRINIGL